MMPVEHLAKRLDLLAERLENQERAIAAQSEVVVTLRRRLEMLERRPLPDRTADLADQLACRI
jgi:hypothetical protein